MRYIIIGLGNYGSVLAKELTQLGNEVIGADNNPHRVDALKDKLSTALLLMQQMRCRSLCFRLVMWMWLL